MRFLAAALFGVGMFAVSPQTLHAGENDCRQGVAETVARQEIEYLRRSYAKATDLIGLADEASVAQGRDIYRRIFTPDATFTVSGEGAPEMNARGPDAWVEVAYQNLAPMGPTQHLIGSQLVDNLELTLAPDCSVASGSALMESYVQAWHDLKQGAVWMFMGTYVDDVVYVPGAGWKIAKMDLVRTTSETRRKLSD